MHSKIYQWSARRICNLKYKKKTAKVYEIRHRYANAHLFYGTPWLTISAKQTTRILNFYQTTKHTTGDNV